MLLKYVCLQIERHDFLPTKVKETRNYGRSRYSNDSCAIANPFIDKDYMLIVIQGMRS